MDRRKFLKALVGAGAATAAAPMIPPSGIISWLKGFFTSPAQVAPPETVTAISLLNELDYLEAWAQEAARNLRDALDREIMAALIEAGEIMNDAPAPRSGWVFVPEQEAYIRFDLDQGHSGPWDKEMQFELS